MIPPNFFSTFRLPFLISFFPFSVFVLPNAVYRMDLMTASILNIIFKIKIIPIVFLLYKQNNLRFTFHSFFGGKSTTTLKRTKF